MPPLWSAACQQARRRPNDTRPAIFLAALAYCSGRARRGALAADAPPAARGPPFVRRGPGDDRAHAGSGSTGWARPPASAMAPALSRTTGRSGLRPDHRHGKTNELLRGETAVLSNQIDDISRDRDRLTGEVDQRRAALEQLETKVTTLSGEAGSETRPSLRRSSNRSARRWPGPLPVAVSSRPS